MPASKNKRLHGRLVRHRMHLDRGIGIVLGDVDVPRDDVLWTMMNNKILLVYFPICEDKFQIAPVDWLEDISEA